MNPAVDWPLMVPVAALYLVIVAVSGYRARKRLWANRKAGSASTWRKYA